MICRIVLEAFRYSIPSIDAWPILGATEYDLIEAYKCAGYYLEEGFTHFPHDDDIELAAFRKWAARVSTTQLGTVVNFNIDILSIERRLADYFGIDPRRLLP